MRYVYTVQVKVISERQIEVESAVPLMVCQIQPRAEELFKRMWCGSPYDRIEVGEIELHSAPGATEVNQHEA